MSVLTHINKIQALGSSRKLTRFFLNRVFWYIGSPWISFKPTRLEDQLPDIHKMVPEIAVHYPLRRTLDTSLELDELCALITLLKYFQAKAVLELGTWDGNTTLNLAGNIPADGSVVTIDLPLDHNAGGALLKSGETLNMTSRQRVGEQFVDNPLASKITQVLGDSAVIDWSNLSGPFDFLFLDGCHTSAYVHSDTKNALTCVKPGGIIVWHDIDGAGAGVVVSAYHKAGINVVWISGTRLGYWQIKDPVEGLRQIAEHTF